MKELKIIIADDHAMIRQGVRSVLESVPGWVVCAEADNGRTAVELARSLAPDIAILDVTMPHLNGVDAIRLLKGNTPDIKVLILTMHESDALADEVARAGGDGYLLKSDASEMLPEAIRLLASGGGFLRSTTLANARKPKKAPPQPKPDRSRLSSRERQIVQLLAEGKSNKQVADILEIRPSTVETHRKVILKKLRLRSTADLVRYAIRNRLIQP
jgi:DNA-binding NarL/FixJ family response regulator